VTPAAGVFEFRLLLHVNAANEISLVKEAIAVLQGANFASVATNTPASLTNRSSSVTLVTDPALLSRLTNVVRLGGRPLATRYSSAAYDYTNAVPPKLALANGTNRLTLILDKTAASNPFFHKYHPDHREGIQVTRTMALTFGGGVADPVREGPGYGVDRITGTYRETLAGLRRLDLVAEGTFSLNRVSDNPALVSSLP